MKQHKTITHAKTNTMKYLFVFHAFLFFSCQITSNAQHTVVEHFNINSCKYKVDSILNNSLIGIAFYDCSGTPIKVFYNDVDTLPEKILNDDEWNLMLKNEVSKLTQKDLYIFLVYGIIVDKNGSISSIEKLSNDTFEFSIEEKIIQLIKQSQWMPAIKNGEPVDYYFLMPIKINLM